MNDALEELRQVLADFAEAGECVEKVGQDLIAALKAGNKVLTCGNGGSAADALHFAEELTGRYRGERRALPAICLSADGTALTCIANDYGFEQVFARQVQAFGMQGDFLVGFSTSGNSPNILAAFKTARERGLRTVLLTGRDGGHAAALASDPLRVPSTTTARIQEVHTLIFHQWLEQIEAVPW